MNARDLLCNLLVISEDRAESILKAIDYYGFTIMSKEDVEAVRDKALEEAANRANGWHPNNFTGQKIATAIRKLKSGGE